MSSDNKVEVVVRLLNNCHRHQGGYGCFECVRKAEDGEVPVDRGPGVCMFDCMICDCDCWSVFVEHNRQKILSTGVERAKKQLEEVKKSGKTSGGDASPKKCGRTAWTEYLFSASENRNVREHQHVDGRSTAKLHQDCRTLAVIDAFSDPIMMDNFPGSYYLSSQSHSQKNKKIARYST